MASRKEIRDEVLSFTDQTNDQIGTLVNDCINATILEIANPAWAYAARKELQHNWTWLRRKTSFSAVASQEDYLLPRDIADIYLVRYINGGVENVLDRMQDEKFYRYEPNPTETGDPYIYRIWGVEGVSTKLAVADTLDVVSSSTSDDGDTELVITIKGQDANDAYQEETYTLNGTTTVSGTKTFKAGTIFVQKQKDTTGNITITENSGSTTVLVMGALERNPLFQVMGVYPLPNATGTFYLHYITHPRTLRNDSDTPEFHENWHYVVRLGTIAKVYQFLNKEESFAAAFQMYSSSVRSMVEADRDEPDLNSKLTRHYPTKRMLGNVLPQTTHVT